MSVVVVWRSGRGAVGGVARWGRSPLSRWMRLDVLMLQFVVVVLLCRRDAGVMTLLKHRGRRSVRYQHEKQPICIFHSLTPCPRPPARQCKYMRNNAVPTVQNPHQTATPAPRPRPRSYAHTRSLRPGTGPPIAAARGRQQRFPASEGGPMPCGVPRPGHVPGQPDRGDRVSCPAPRGKRGWQVALPCGPLFFPFFPFFPLVSLCLQGRRWCCFAYPLRTSR